MGTEFYGMEQGPHHIKYTDLGNMRPSSTPRANHLILDAISCRDV